MSIYTAIGIQGGRPSLVFADRELNLAPAQVDEAGIIPIPRPKPSLHYTAAVAWIHLFGASILDKKVYTMRPAMYNVLKGIPERIPVQPPVLAIHLTGLTTADKELLIGYGMSESSQSRGNIWLGRPTLTSFKALTAKFGMDDSPVPAGNVSCSGYFAFHMAWKAIGLFSIVTTALGDNSNILFFSPNSKNILVKKGEKGHIGNGMPEGVDFSGLGEGSTTFVQAPNLVPISTPLKQVATRTDYTWKVTESQPGNGFIFPYFHGLLLPSKDYVSHVFFHIFQSCFCDNEDEFRVLAPTLRRGFRNLQNTRGGLELQHIYFGINSANELGGALRVIREGSSYLGFSILGTGGVFLDKNTVREPLGTEELKAIRLSLSVHTNALVAIKAILEEFPMMTGDTEEIDIEDYRTNSRRLADHLQARDLSSITEPKRQALVAALEKLAYGDIFWEPTPENIIIVLRAMLSGKWLHPEAPYYHGKGCGLSLNIFVRSLAVFGPECPDIFMGNEIRQIARPGRDDTNLEKKDGTRQRLPYIPVYMQPILTAAGHWKAVQNQSQLRFVGPRKGKKEFANRIKLTTEISGPHFDTFYPILRDFVGQKDAKETSSKGKRKATETMEVDDRGGSSADGSIKKAKIDISSMY